MGDSRTSHITYKVTVPVRSNSCNKDRYTCDIWSVTAWRPDDWGVFMLLPLMAVKYTFWT